MRVVIIQRDIRHRLTHCLRGRVDRGSLTDVDQGPVSVKMDARQPPARLHHRGRESRSGTRDHVKGAPGWAREGGSGEQTSAKSDAARSRCFQMVLNPRRRHVFSGARSVLAAVGFDVLQGHVPRKENPRVLADLGDERIHLRASFGLGIDRRQMCIGIKSADDLEGFA